MMCDLQGRGMFALRAGMPWRCYQPLVQICDRKMSELLLRAAELRDGIDEMVVVDQNHVFCLMLGV